MGRVFGVACLYDCFLGIENEYDELILLPSGISQVMSRLDEIMRLVTFAFLEPSILKSSLRRNLL